MIRTCSSPSSVTSAAKMSLVRFTNIYTSSRLLRNHQKKFFVFHPDTIQSNQNHLYMDHQRNHNSMRNISFQFNKNEEIPDHFDFVVIGGGSGGIACSKQLSLASNSNTKICLLDYRDPSNHWLAERNGKLNGWLWPLGGTCVNVGCIPKKLMHKAAQIGETLSHDAAEFGWKLKTEQHDWKILVSNVQNYIKSLNFGYRTAMTHTYAFDAQDSSQKKLYYLNMKAKFINDHTLELTDPRKQTTRTITADRIIISVGGTPNIPSDVPGANEYCITSDDIFSLREAPGKTLVIGASYIALETASFLRGLGYDSTVMMRSIPLRGFDQECAWKIVDGMKDRGTKFLERCIPVKIEKIDGEHDEYLVHYKNLDNGAIHTEKFNTVMFAVGRRAVTSELNITLDMDDNGKIMANEREETSKNHIYAIGDCINRKTELTPVAIKAGTLLANRLCSVSSELMDYDNVPTTIFTHPYEYGCCGLSEEEAIARFGEDQIEVYISKYAPIEHSLAHRDENKTFMKLICHKTNENTERVIGFHYIGDNAGEITMGVAVAMKSGATKQDFDNTIGIHPTAAEEMTFLTITKRSGKSAEKAGC
ncbi:hypothetical protein C9374_012192 [Naegleria lovaniensis]|uniref:Thioredoxin reductase n=1 Tax=Naegleria lovaniensis TaxID=51637 RepID=A0AA88KEL1_NAELO|nr:uncharacterized protein C9374_012192 [Naegleria lovaniensis]KAG2373326.1 hypothetical protein C9374_012192 [Naegleria lovaniensis]